MLREIYPDRLFVGNAMDARDMIYCRPPLIDGDGNSDALIETAVRCVVMLVHHEIRTMVVCSAGMSRSLAIAAATMAIVNGRSPGDCLHAIVAAAPHDVSPTLWSRVKSAYNGIVDD